MTIRKGEPWGSPGPLPEGAEVVDSDRALRQLITDARTTGRDIGPIGLLGGDLCRTIGGVGDAARLRSADAIHLPVDLGMVLIDGRRFFFVAHLVARRALWQGRFVVAMNAQWLGGWNLAPRSHPNDGRLETTSGRLGWRDRLLARRRVRLGEHLPHPGLTTRSVKAEQFELDRSIAIRLDGELVAQGSKLSIRVEPDAITVVV